MHEKERNENVWDWGVRSFSEWDFELRKNHPTFYDFLADYLLIILLWMVIGFSGYILFLYNLQFVDATAKITLGDLIQIIGLYIAGMTFSFTLVFESSKTRSERRDQQVQHLAAQKSLLDVLLNKLERISSNEKVKTLGGEETDSYCVALTNLLARDGFVVPMYPIMPVNAIEFEQKLDLTIVNLEIGGIVNNLYLIDEKIDTINFFIRSMLQSKLLGKGPSVTFVVDSKGSIQKILESLIIEVDATKKEIRIFKSKL